MQLNPLYLEQVWLTGNSAGHYKRATVSALQLAIANCGGESWYSLDLCSFLMLMRPCYPIVNFVISVDEGFVAAWIYRKSSYTRPYIFFGFADVSDTQQPRRGLPIASHIL